ncbi:MAG TPA: DUF1127 domain-containing protein [Alphaproteobacteria bacterium]|jgi:uncharacterized protein YjiS (DUF1127 family)|nr:DUF1127 domain-containing protein [Alphaproteobacteria bacterium]
MIIIIYFRVLLVRLSDVIARWQDRAQARQQLAAMNGQALRDIGLTWYAAELEIRKPFWRA